jgi:hypothetical protein
MSPAGTHAEEADRPPWPCKRGDGSMSIGARFKASPGPQRDAVARVLSGWNARRARSDWKTRGVVKDELASEPYVVVVDDETIDVVADVRPGSWGWKIILGLMTYRIAAETDATFEGYLDRLSGVLRPAGELGWRAIDSERWGDPRWGFLDAARPMLLAAFAANGVTQVDYVAVFPEIDGVSVWLCTTTDAERDALDLSSARPLVRQIMLHVGFSEQALSGSGLGVTKQSQETVDRDFKGKWFYAMK